MSAVAIQSRPLGLHPTFHQNRHSAPPPASLTASVKRTPGIITLSKPVSTPQRSPRQRKATPSNTPRDAPRDAPAPTPKSEKSRKPRSRPTSDEDEHETPSKARGRRPNNQEKTAPSTPAPKTRRNQSRTRQTPSPDSDSPPAPQLQKPSGRLAKQRRGFTKSTPALCAAVAAPGSAPVPIPQLSNSNSHPSGLSRSAPLATPAMSQSIPARMRRTLTGGSPGHDDPTAKDVPPSPSPPRRVREGKSQGPLTAPLHGGAGFPGRPKHTRTPSEALFNMSLDETDDEPQDMPILFTRSRGGDKVYAGGRFQNGPDPTMLPAPSFLSGF